MLYTPAFWALALANLSHTASFSAMFLLPLFVTEQGGDQADVGLVMGLFALASALCRPWVAEMIDRIGRKRSYSLGALIMTVSPLLYLAVPDPLGHLYGVFLALRILHGVGMAICFTGVFTYIADLVPKRRLNEGIGMFGISGLVGIALGPLLAELVLEQTGYQGFFLTTSGLALIALLAPQALRESLTEPHPKTASPSFFGLLARPRFLRVGLLSLLFGIGVAATSNFVAPLVDARPIGLVSFYYLAYSSGAIAARLLGGRLADRLGEQRVLPYGLILYAAGLLVLPAIWSQGLLILAGLASGCGHGLLFPTLNALAIRDQPDRDRGKATGVFTGGIDTGSFAGSLVLGYIGKWFGFNPLFIIAAFGMLSGLLVFRSSQPRKTLS